MTTSTFDGAQPPLSVNRTENLIVIAGEPEPGDAVPPLSVGFVAPLQFAAAARAELELAGSPTTTMATARAKAAVLAFRSR